jgi:hypothetical protein
MSPATASASFARCPSFFVELELPAGRHLRRELRLVLRLSRHLLGVFLLEEGVGSALRGCKFIVELRGLRSCEGHGLESALHIRGGVCEARSTNADHQGYRGLRCWGGEVLQSDNSIASPSPTCNHVSPEPVGN